MAEFDPMHQPLTIRRTVVVLEELRMSVNRFLVRSFRVTLAQNVTGPGLDTQVGATISCYAEDKKEGELVIAFVRPGFELPSNHTRADGTVGFVFVPAADFSWYFEVLNSAARLRARISSRDPATNQLETLIKRDGAAERLTRRTELDSQ